MDIDIDINSYIYTYIASAVHLWSASSPSSSWSSTLQVRSFQLTAGLSPFPPLTPPTSFATQPCPCFLETDEVVAQRVRVLCTDCQLQPTPATHLSHLSLPLLATMLSTHT